MLGKIIQYRPVIYLLIACSIVFGAMSYASLPRESFPEIDIPMVIVSTPYIGVAPEDIESLITNPIENELAGLKDLKKMSSASVEGASVITLEFEPEANIQEALQQIRDRVDRAKPDLPKDAEDTEVREVSFSDIPVIIVTLAGDVDESLLKKLGEDLEDEVRRIPGVLDAKLAGGRKREIRVEVDPRRLEHYALGLNDVVSAISKENVNIPGGNIRAGDANFLLRVPGEVINPFELESVAVKRVGDRPVFIRDVARVVDDFEERESYARMNGKPAVSLSITKRSGTNLLAMIDEVKSVTKANAKRWPKGVTYRFLGDQSKDIRMMISELQNDIGTSLILVIAVLLFFMGVRNSLLVGFTIPLSMLIAFIVVSVLGMTLNMMVLFSLILALGMFIDNGIVVVENIYRHVEEGKSLLEASIEGTREVAVAITSSTATNIVAYIPMLFWTGIMGEFMVYLPKTVMIVLVSSLLVSLVMVPVLTSRFKPAQTAEAREEKAAPKHTGYYRLLEYCVDHAKLILWGGVAALIFTLVAYGFLNHGTEFFPNVEPKRAVVAVRAPDGTDLEATDEIVRQIEGMVAEEENVDVYITETGVSGGGDPLSGAQAAENQARITIDFLPDEGSAEEGQKLRVEHTTKTIARLREKVRVIPGAEINVDKQEDGPPVGADVAIEVSGDDFHQLGEIAARVRRELIGTPGIVNLSDNYRVGRPEIRFRIDRGAAKQVGASTQDIAQTIRTAFDGAEASKLRDGEDEYDITVELDPAFRDDLQAVLNLRIPGREDTSPDTFPVPLSSVASFELAGGSGSIRHIDQKRVITVDGDIRDDFNQNAVRADVAKYLQKTSLKQGYSMRLGGADDEQRKSQEFLSRAFLIGLFLIVIVLVLEFNRFDLPIIVMSSVIMSLIGVFWGLIITGTPFGVIMTGIGVISLAGVVVNNAIVLLDYTEQLRERGMSVREAVLKAGSTRFRPVMLTAVTGILGLVPMALGISLDLLEGRVTFGSETTQWWGPMSVAVIFGLAFATVLTLLLVPTMYYVIENRRVRRDEKRAQKLAVRTQRTSDHEPRPTSAVVS